MENEMRKEIDKFYYFGRKEPLIIKAIDESLKSGDLKRLKTIYKGLPENWNDDYLIRELIKFLND